MRRGKLVAIGLLIMLVGPTCRAATMISLPINGSASTQYQPGDPGDPESVRFAGVSLSGTLTPLSIDFSQPASKQLTVEFKAPEGQSFWADIPDASSGWDNSTLVFQWYFSGVFTGSGIFVDNAPLIAFGNLTGTAPVLISAVVEFSGPNAGPNSGGGLISASFSPALGSSFSFDSITISTTIPDTYNAQYASSAIPSVEAGLLDIGFTAADPGTWFGVAAVPEPSLLSLVGIGFGALALRRLRIRRS